MVIPLLIAAAIGIKFLHSKHQKKKALKKQRLAEAAAAALATSRETTPLATPPSYSDSPDIHDPDQKDPQILTQTSQPAPWNENTETYLPQYSRDLAPGEAKALA